MDRLLIILFLLIISPGQQFKFVKVKIDKNISVKLPADFTPVPATEMGTKYISYRSPIALYSNLTKEVDFSVNYSISQWQSTDLELVKSFYKSNIANLFDSIEYIRDTIEEINDRDYIILEFTSTITEDKSVVRSGTAIKKYYYIQYTLKQGHIFIFSFSAPHRIMNEWQPIAKAVMETVKLD